MLKKTVKVFVMDIGFQSKISSYTRGIDWAFLYNHVMVYLIHFDQRFLLDIGIQW